MIVTERYSHKGGEEYINANNNKELREVIEAIESLNAADCLRKTSSESTKPALVFSPVYMNQHIKKILSNYGWTESAPESKKGIREPRISLGDRAFREMDGIKNMVGLEIQLGKYSFMGYDIFSKMPIFANLGLIECGIEVVVNQTMIKDMSTGVSSFTQIRKDMEYRGVADIDIPTLILGFECSSEEWEQVALKRERYAANPDLLIANGEVFRDRKGAKPGPK